MQKTIYFDMDGTVYDMYNVAEWEKRLRNHQSGVFTDGQPLVNIQALQRACMDAIQHGYKIGVITWLPMQSTKEYNKACRLEKKLWIKKFMPYVTEFHAVKYGTPKHRVGNDKRQILFDDNASVRKAWNGNGGIAHDVQNIVETIERLCA